MAISDTRIANMALIEVGVETISSLSGQSKSANVMNEIYEQTRDELLSQYQWNFAMERQALSSAPTPLFEFAYAFILPTNPFCLRAVEMYNSEENFKIEGRKLFTNISAVNLKYIARITDPAQFSPGFIAAFVTLLASRAVLPLKKDAAAKVALFDLHEIALLKAKAADGQEGTPEEFESTELSDVRFQTGA